MSVEDDIELLRDEITQLRQEKDDLADEFHQHQLETMRWRGEFALSTNKLFEKAMDAPNQEQKKEKREAADFRVRVYAAITCVMSIIAGWPYIKAGLHVMFN